MTQNEKDLLIKDLCARLQYGVKCKSKYFTDDTLSGIIIDEGETVFNFSVNNEGFIIQLYISGIKPYLFPLSSMTEEQLYELREMFGFEIEFRDGLIEVSTFHHNSLGYLEMDAMFEWFNRNHFDYRGLIEKGLAIDATNLNIY